MKHLFNRNLGMRIVSGSVLGVITGFCLWKGEFYFSIFILTVAIISYLEWFTITSNNLAEKDHEYCRKHVVFWGTIGLLLILPCAISMIYMRYLMGLEKVLYLVLVVTATDIGAFVFGKLIGGPKLAPSISPGKTISGSISGMMVAVGLGVTLRFYDHTVVSYTVIAICTLILSLVSQIGDLSESAFKRHFGVKDSSKLIPGHGGFLDRADSFLFTAPVFVIMHWIGYF